MAELILPGVYIDVRPEGLIVPGQITVGNLGVVGTAQKGEVGTETKRATLVSSYGDAAQIFGAYDSFLGADGKRRNDAGTPPKPTELTLVRALEQAFAFGATTVFAVRVAGSSAASASYTLLRGADEVVKLTAKTPGTWGNQLQVNAADAEENAFIEKEDVTVGDPPAPKLAFNPAVSLQNRITHTSTATGIKTVFPGNKIVYTGAPGADQAGIDPANGNLSFHASLKLSKDDKISAAYVVNKASSLKVTLKLGGTEEVYTVVSGKDLIADIKEKSSLVNGEAKAKVNDLPDKSVPDTAFANFKSGDDGASGADYAAGLDVLLNEDAHIIVAAGQDDSFGNAIDKHCQKASTDVIKRDRIGVVGSRPEDLTMPEEFFDYLRGQNLSSDRIIFVAPGIKARDAGASPAADVILPGAYAAAAFAGFLASLSPHISATNKVLPVDGLERIFTSPELTQLIQHGVLALEKRQGFRIVRGITTLPPGSAFAQITTRRIVDYAKFGVRSAATPYIGLLNNERVRGALKATVNSFLAEMVNDEMLVSYKLDVTATRDDERKGVARVTMTLQPTFSIDYIKVTMFLE